MKIKKGEEGFWETFEHAPVPDEWQRELYHYIILGLNPGSFFTAVLSNDLMQAAGSSHVLNDWRAIMALCQWLYHEAPAGSHGNETMVKEWLALTDVERQEICIRKGFLLTEEQLTWHIVKEQ